MPLYHQIKRKRKSKEKKYKIQKNRLKKKKNISVQAYYNTSVHKVYPQLTSRLAVPLQSFKHSPITYIIILLYS